MKKPLSLIALPLILAGCATLNATSETAGPHEATAHYDETAHIGRLNVTPLDMEEDSRCPQGVQCIWAGRVKLKVALVEDGQSSEAVLTMNEPVMTSGGALMLVAASPYPSITAKYAKSAYRFTFRLDRSAPTPSAGPCRGMTATKKRKDASLSKGIDGTPAESARG